MNPHDDHPKVRPLAQKQAALETTLGQARARLAEIERERVDAVRADRQAVADAARAGKPAPSTDAIREKDEALAACQREIEAMEIAVRDQAAAVAGAVDKHRPEWLGEVQERIAAGHERLRDAVEAFAAARASLAGDYSLRAWLNGDHPGEPQFLASVQSLRTPAGEAQSWAAVEQALRTMADGTAKAPRGRFDPIRPLPKLKGPVSGDLAAQEARLRRVADKTGRSVLDLAALPTEELEKLAARLPADDARAA